MKLDHAVIFWKDKMIISRFQYFKSQIRINFLGRHDNFFPCKCFSSIKYHDYFISHIWNKYNDINQILYKNRRKEIREKIKN